MPAEVRFFREGGFILAESCQDYSAAAEAAHVYREHENLLCRIIPDEAGEFHVYVGRPRIPEGGCSLSWCPHTDDPNARRRFFPASPSEEQVMVTNIRALQNALERRTNPGQAVRRSMRRLVM